MNDIEPGSPLRIANKLFVLFRLVSHLTQLTIDLRANQNYEAGDVQPEHENHECPQRTVGGVVRSEVADVKVERQSIGRWYSERPRKQNGITTFVYAGLCEGPFTFSIILIRSARDLARIFSIARLR